jgi:hypothetical protein
MDRFDEWCKQELARLRDAIVPLHEGRIRFYERSGRDRKDTTASFMLRISTKITELDELLPKHA